MPMASASSGDRKVNSSKRHLAEGMELVTKISGVGECRNIMIKGA
jgi:hypothetical protein